MRLILGGEIVKEPNGLKSNVGLSEQFNLQTLQAFIHRKARMVVLVMHTKSVFTIFHLYGS